MLHCSLDKSQTGETKKFNKFPVIFRSYRSSPVVTLVRSGLCFLFAELTHITFIKSIPCALNLSVDPKQRYLWLITHSERLRDESFYLWLFSSRVKNPIDLHSIFSSCLSWFSALLSKYSMRSPSVLGITEFFRNSYLIWSVKPGLSLLARRKLLYKESTCFWRRLRTITNQEQGSITQFGP